MTLFFKTLAAIAALSLVLPLMVWGSGTKLRHALRAWATWWLYGLVALAAVGVLALAQLAIERI